MDYIGIALDLAIIVCNIIIIVLILKGKGKEK